MAKIQSFEELECWKSAKELTLAVYLTCNSEKLKREFSAQDQIKRASVSIMNNIAEGFGRFSNKEFIRFLTIASSSAQEVHSMLILFKDLGFISETEFQKLLELAKKTKHQTLAFIKYLNSVSKVP
ncbi:MAG: four helix bundle protein [Cyclobacteriaceae bacterium]